MEINPSETVSAGCDKTQAPVATNTDSQRVDEFLKGILQDKKSERRFKYIKFGVITGIFATYMAVIGMASSGMGAAESVNEPYAALVKMTGEIGANKPLSFNATAPLLEKAFRDENAKGVVVLMNSPGGSPVQSSLIHDRIVQLKKENPDKKVVVVAEDMIASGGYFIGVAADKIIVNRSTLAGSIGVISQQFGVTSLMDKIGVESRTLTAGDSKNRMSMFENPSEADREKIRTVLGDIHEHFKDVVRTGREGKLTKPESELFNGDFWTGQEAVELGLADELGDLPTALKNEFGVTKYKEYAPKVNFIEAITKGLAVSLATELSTGVQNSPVQAKIDFQ